MLLLFIIWACAVAILLGETGYVFVHSRTGGFEEHSSKDSFFEFLTDEILAMMRWCYRLGYSILPHGKRVLVVASTGGRRATDMFAKRVFGRVEIRRGTAVSFFLKHIAENQEKDRRSGGEKQGW